MQKENQLDNFTHFREFNHSSSLRILTNSLLPKSPTKSKSKLAIFDFDQTLLKETAFASIRHDIWHFQHHSVPTVLQNLQKNNYTILIITNQLGISQGYLHFSKLINLIKEFLIKCQIFAYVFIATEDDEFRKPAIGAYLHFFDFIQNQESHENNLESISKIKSSKNASNQTQIIKTKETQNLEKISFDFDDKKTKNETLKNSEDSEQETNSSDSKVSDRTSYKVERVMLSESRRKTKCYNRISGQMINISKRKFRFRMNEKMRKRRKSKIAKTRNKLCKNTKIVTKMIKFERKNVSIENQSNCKISQSQKNENDAKERTNEIVLKSKLEHELSELQNKKNKEKPELDFCLKMKNDANFGLGKNIDICSFYCGDGAGRINGHKSDFSSTDFLFAVNIKVNFILPEQIFEGDKNVKMLEIPIFPFEEQICQNDKKFRDGLDLKAFENTSKSNILVLLMGPPGCGKTHFANTYFSNFKIVSYVV